MGISRINHPVKLVAGLIYHEEASAEMAVRLLKSRFGPLDYQCEQLPFTCTSYYQREMGAPLHKKFVSFRTLVPAGALARIKLTAMRMESRLSAKGSRTVNIDPGYLTLAKVVLATTKEYSHRLYLDKGIFGELTYTYRNNTFTPLEWTYPDYRTPEYLGIFNHIRGLYATHAEK